MIDERDVGATSLESKVLESGVSLSQSVIWGLQRDYYARRGLKAWSEDNVPSYITSNPFIAEVYAGIVAAFIDDSTSPSVPGAAQLSPERPLRILELGAGTGKFAYLFLRKLTALLEVKKIPPQVIRYCMADCSQDLLAAWKENPYLARFTAAGILEFDLLLAGEENSSQPEPCNLAGGTLVVIANYVFDSLPLDAFVINQGKMEEALITTSAGPADGGNTPSPGSLQFSFNNVPVPQHRYTDKVWNGILEHYRSSVPAATIFFPTAALDLLQHLAASSNGCMLVLAADKGFTREENLALRQGEPQLEFHASGNCFSAIVNFDAIARYFWSTGGEAFLPQKHFSNLSLCAFLQHPPEQEFPATRQAYCEASQVFGPDDLFTLMTWLESHLNELTIPQALSVLRLTRWDPTALLQIFPVIAPQLRSVGAERIDLRDAVFSVMANRFPISRSDNELAFYCGVILLELRFFAEAMEMFTISEQTLGRSAATSYNLGLCAAGQGRSEEALAFMVKACDQDPKFAPAQSARARLEGERKQS
ncbi:MAG TPA: SAM-dependent methyltransferase [Candidatus Angelobacter sp.]|nr:SAM-dependent methyltransferase [Candidatus Angelobacter sp.]